MKEDTNHYHLTILICLLLAIVTLAVFWEVQYHEFINLDDDWYVYDNPNVKTGLTYKNIKWAFTTLHAGFWMPLTWLSHMLDCQLYDLNPKGHHFNNLLFHITNTIFLFLILKRMTKAIWPSAFVAALFALHPLHVEPVAWVTSRKDVLSGFFWMMTIWLYTYYAERPGIKRYLLVFLSFAFGLMAKPIIVTMPFVLLLLDYWPLKRLRIKHLSINCASHLSKNLNNDQSISSKFWLLYEKIPFLILSILSGLIAFLAEKRVGALPSLESFPIVIRLANALESYLDYILHMIWPLNLSVFYPHTGIPSWWHVLVALVILLGISFLAVWNYQKHSYLLVGWFWYLGTLVPVIGLIQVGKHAMADRYTYIPLIGLFIIISWGIQYIFKNFTYKKLAYSILAGATLLFFTANTQIQISYWRNSSTLFKHAIDITSDNYLAHNNLAYALIHQGDLEGATSHLYEALRIKPDYLEHHMNLGAVLARQGKLDEAIKQFLWELDTHPGDERLV